MNENNKNKDIKNITEAKIWFKRANQNLLAAKITYENKLFPESVYHSQQASKKVLKTVLIIFGEDICKHKVTSYFDDLVSLKFNFDFEKIINYSFELERHWLSSKYPIKRRDETIIDPEDLYNKTKTFELYKKADFVIKEISKFLKEELDLDLLK